MLMTYGEIFVAKIEPRLVGKPKLSWLGSVEEDLKMVGVRNWRRK
jgi:hypothetical protein